MKKDKALSGKKDPAYTELVRLIKNEIELGRRLIEHQKALGYWKVGGRIWSYQLKNQERAPYRERLFFWLSQDLDINERTLQQSVRFHREFPIPKPASQLSWTHYCLLLTVQDSVERARWQERIIQEGLNSKQLRKQIREYNKSKRDESRSRASQSPQQPEKLEVTRGKLWTHKVLEPETIRASGEIVVLDCGFDIWREVSCSNADSFQEGDIVEATENSSGATIEKSSAAAEELFTFAVKLEKVIDADTLWVHIDCGFATWTRQKLRLKGIDAPEISTEPGRRAKQFVQDRLTKALCIIIKTYKSDKYDRYLSDIFYSHDTTDPERTAAEGIFLNQELLDAGLATVWKD